MNKLYQLLTINKISADDLMFLYHIKEGVEISEKLFNYSTERLLKAKCVKIEEDCMLVTNKGTRLINQALDMFKDTGILVTEENIDEFITTYRLLFPVGKRAHKGALKIKFQKFFKNYDYSFDMILTATKRYIKDLNERQATQFMKQADYFIEKNGDSMLLNILSELEEVGTANVPKDKTNILKSLYGAK
jgi:hypothetical protein